VPLPFGELAEPDLVEAPGLSILDASRSDRS